VQQCVFPNSFVCALVSNVPLHFPSAQGRRYPLPLMINIELP